MGIEPTSGKLNPEASTCVSFPLRSHRDAWAEGFRRRGQSGSDPGAASDPLHPLIRINVAPASAANQSPLPARHGLSRESQFVVGSCKVSKCRLEYGTQPTACLFPVESGTPPKSSKSSGTEPPSPVGPFTHHNA